MRISGRKDDELRTIEVVPNYIDHAEGSCLISYGKTRILCVATIEDKVPIFLRGTGQGWISAEYSLLPRSTHSRTDRESVKGKQSGRTHEIQRLIGRALRSTLDLSILGEKQIKVDCDVIQADGSTRCASISGACIALGLAIKNLKLKRNPFVHLVAGISCGIVDGNIIVDLDYMEDSNADVDGNFAILDSGALIEVQSTAEKKSFTDEQLLEMIKHARNSVKQIFEIQKEILLA